MSDMGENELILAAIADLKSETVRVRESVHQFRNEVTAKISSLELTQANAKAEIALLQNNQAHFKEKMGGWDTGVDRRFSEHERRMMSVIESIKVSLESTIASAHTTFQARFDDIKIVRKDRIGWAVAVFMTLFNVLFMLMAKRMGWL